MGKVKEVDWELLKKAAYGALKKKGLNGVYLKRLEFELKEIEQQGANRYWTDTLNHNKKFNHNKNGLLLPWLLRRLTDEADKDPIADIEHPTLSTNYKKVKKYIDENGKLPADIHQDDDKPDIDIDCLPYARDYIKNYAAETYGEDKVASVGTWSTYLFKQAIQDVAGALGLKKERAIALTRELPEIVNDMKDGGYGKCKSCGTMHMDVMCPKKGCKSKDTETPTLGALIAEFKEIQDYIDEDSGCEGVTNDHVIKTAARLVGKIRSMGKHAGAIIIADRPLLGNIPMAFDKKSGQWSSMWTEGRSTQLSKFGYNKWDMLGLRNLQYVHECCKMIEANYGISFGERMKGWHEYVDPEIDQAGVYWKDGKKHKISLNDKKALSLANDCKTDAVFQFDTDLAKRILSNGVRSFHDLMIFNAMGHPGPMGMIPEYVRRRNDPKASWREGENDLIAKILGDTAGVIVFQEQLQSMWQVIAGFTAPEAQGARKAVAKKWRDKLKPVRQKWIDGASRFLGKELAKEWWDDRMETFGRYAFNKSHSVAYCLIAYHCLWLKAYFPEEWWAAVMSYCHPDKLIRYMNVARGEGVKFGEVNIGNMTTHFTVNDKCVSLGLISLKNVGKSKCDIFTDEIFTCVDCNKTVDDPNADSCPYCSKSNGFTRNIGDEKEYNSIDEFVEEKGKDKIVLERLIKLGAFRKMYPNIRATWIYYQYKYCSGNTSSDIADIADKITELKGIIRERLLESDGWNDAKLKEEIERQTKEYFALHPKRKKIPKSIENYKPKPDDSPEKVMALFTEDYDFKQVLEFEKEYLGYYWHSPADLYRTSDRATKEQAKTTGVLQGVITEINHMKTKNGKDMWKLFVNDGTTEALLILWDSNMPLQPKGLIQVDKGIQALVDYDDKRGSFTLQRRTVMKPLKTKENVELTGYEEVEIEDI